VDRLKVVERKKASVNESECESSRLENLHWCTCTKCGICVTMSLEGVVCCTVILCNIALYMNMIKLNQKHLKHKMYTSVRRYFREDYFVSYRCRSRVFQSTLMRHLQFKVIVKVCISNIYILTTKIMARCSSGIIF